MQVTSFLSLFQRNKKIFTRAWLILGIILSISVLGLGYFFPQSSFGVVLNIVWALLSFYWVIFLISQITKDDGLTIHKKSIQTALGLLICAGIFYIARFEGLYVVSLVGIIGIFFLKNDIRRLAFIGLRILFQIIWYILIDNTAIANQYAIYLYYSLGLFVILSIKIKIPHTLRNY